MDWSILLVLALIGAFFWWRHNKGVEAAKAANARLASDTRLNEHIKAGVRELQWHRREEVFRLQKTASFCLRPRICQLSMYVISRKAGWVSISRTSKNMACTALS